MTAAATTAAAATIARRRGGGQSRDDRPHLATRARRPSFHTPASRGDRRLGRSTTLAVFDERPARSSTTARVATIGPHTAATARLERDAKDAAKRKAFEEHADTVHEKLQAEAIQAEEVADATFGHGLGDNIVRALADLGAASPFPIQAATIARSSRARTCSPAAAPARARRSRSARRWSSRCCAARPASAASSAAARRR
jgi:hypothetical protein